MGMREHDDVLGAFDYLRERGFEAAKIGVVGLSSYLPVFMLISSCFRGMSILIPSVGNRIATASERFASSRKP